MFWSAGTISVNFINIFSRVFNRVIHLVKNTFIFAALFLAYVTFRNKIIVICLMLEVAKVDFVYDA